MNNKMHKLCKGCARTLPNFDYEGSCDGNELKKNSITFGPAGTCSMYYAAKEWYEDQKKKSARLTHNPFDVLSKLK